MSPINGFWDFLYAVCGYKHFVSTALQEVSCLRHSGRARGAYSIRVSEASYPASSRAGCRHHQMEVGFHFVLLISASRAVMAAV